MVKNPPANEGDVGLIPGSRRSPGAGNSNPLQYSCLENPMDWSLPGSPIHGIFQARILEWVAISSSRGSSWPRDQTHISCLDRRILYHRVTWEALASITCMNKKQQHPCLFTSKEMSINSKEISLYRKEFMSTVRFWIFMTDFNKV